MFQLQHHRKIICLLAACNTGALAVALNLVVGLNPEDK